MTCAELREVAAAYALGALEPGERSEVERHLAAAGPHDGCHEAVVRARATAAELARALPEVTPDPAVWRAIEVRAGRARRRFSTPVGPVGWAAVAAAALALVFLQLERLELRRQREEVRAAQASSRAADEERDRVRQALQALEGAASLERDALALLDRPGTRLVPLAPQAGHDIRATAILNLAEGRAFVVSATLSPQPGKSYQLWVLRGTAPPRPAGFLRSAPAGASAGEVDRTLLSGGAPDALAVSLEPEGGSPAPTQVLMIGKVSG